MLVTYSSDIAVYSSTFDSNRAGRYGGVVHTENSEIMLYMYNSSFANNTASYVGGVVYAYDISITVNYSSFSDNQAGNDGDKILEVFAYNQVHNVVNSTVSCSLNSSDGGLDVGQDLQNINTVCTRLYFTLYSPHNYEELILSLDSTCNELGITEQRITIEITCSCTIGFQVHNNDQTSCDCVCDKVLQSYDRTDCDKQSQSIIRKDNFKWINYINHSQSSGYVIYPNCPYDYCHTPEESIAINLNNPEGYEAQCASHRSRTLCGSCKQNFSVSLGSSSCLLCPTYWPGIRVTIITAFILSSICLVALLLVLNIMVATGTLNIIFYANIMAAIKNTMLSLSKVRFASIFISWLNFDIGFDTCFFDGMDMYMKTWFQLVEEIR